MSSHEYLGESDHSQPEQPFIELDPAKLLGETIAAQARAPVNYMSPKAAARLEFLRTLSQDGPLDDLDFAILKALDNRPDPALPSGLPPRLLELWVEEDRNGTQQTDVPQ
jgi:hypothetical protein